MGPREPSIRKNFGREQIAPANAPAEPRETEERESHSMHPI